MRTWILVLSSHSYFIIIKRSKKVKIRLNLHYFNQNFYAYAIIVQHLQLIFMLINSHAWEVFA